MPARCLPRWVPIPSRTCTLRAGSDSAGWRVPTSWATWISAFPAASRRCSAVSIIRSEPPASPLPKPPASRQPLEERPGHSEVREVRSSAERREACVLGAERPCAPFELYAGTRGKTGGGHLIVPREHVAVRVIDRTQHRGAEEPHVRSRLQP